MGERKKFLVLELDKKDAVRLCLKELNHPYKNYTLNCKKPRGFFRRLYDPEQDEIEAINDVAMNALSTTHRIYMGNIPTYLKENEVRKVCESYGMLKHFSLATLKDANGDI